jgi:hypothetical protein
MDHVLAHRWQRIIQTAIVNGCQLANLLNGGVGYIVLMLVASCPSWFWRTWTAVKCGKWQWRWGCRSDILAYKASFNLRKDNVLHTKGKMRRNVVIAPHWLALDREDGYQTDLQHLSWPQIVRIPWQRPWFHCWSWSYSDSVAAGLFASHWPRHHSSNVESWPRPFPHFSKHDLPKGTQKPGHGVSVEREMIYQGLVNGRRPWVVSTQFVFHAIKMLVHDLAQGRRGRLGSKMIDQAAFGAEWKWLAVVQWHVMLLIEVTLLQAFQWSHQ